MRAGLFLAAFVLAAMAMLTSTPARAIDGCVPPAGFMRSIQGQVEIKRGVVDWRPAVLDESLCAGDLIRVGDRSRAVAAIANLMQRIDQNTTLSLTYVPAEKPRVIGLTEGAVYFFSRKPRILEVDTPFFDAAVEGTEFLVRVEAQRALLTVFDGRITARNPQGELTVANGQSLTAEAGQAPAPYVLVRPRDAVQWALFYPIILLPLADRSGAAAREIAGPLSAAVELAARGEYAAAFATFESIPDPDRGAEFYLYRAATLLSVGRVDDARTDIDQALAGDPSDGRAYALSAVIAVAQNERDRALADGERGVELSPRSAAAQIALSYAEQAQFRIEQARETMQQAVRDEPENALAWARLSELWLMQGYRDRALKAAKKARKLAPELGRVETVLGFAALAAIDIAKAKQAFSRAIALNSADPQARFGLGLATIRGGDLEQGGGDIEVAVALDPDESLLRSYLGKAYFDERTTDPEKYLRELFTNFPNQENTLAAEQFAIAKRLDPNDPTPWLYDAIRKQSENRPVEALHDIEKSIELNDNRAVYRSRELLDQDRASRGTSLARIYNDLGFEQLGINEATKSLSIDPANAGAHRFLSDVYLTQPRREIARVSELLQAQLLQDININPVQPSLSETNLSTGGGPARPGFNEFTSLFERNQAQLNLSGEVGNDATRGGEAVVSGIYDWLSLSAGQYHFQTNGFRKNFQINHNITDLYAQAAITPELNVQAEFRRRRLDLGDISLNVDPDLSLPNLQRDLDQDTGRLGIRYSPSPRSDIVGSFIYNLRHSKTQEPDIFRTDFRGHQTGLQEEVEYIYQHDRFNILAGFGHYHIDADLQDRIQEFRERSNWENDSIYVYNNINIPKQCIWTLGASYDDYNSNSSNIKTVNPKTGLQCYVTDWLRVRLAALKAVKPALLANQTIEPTQVAGFNQFFDDFNGTKTWIYGGGLDAYLAEGLNAGAEFSFRELDEPSSENPHFTEHRDDSLYRGYLYWAPYKEWVLRGGVEFDYFNAKQPSTDPRQVGTWSVPLGIRYFNPTGLFAGVGATYVRQHVIPRGPPVPEGTESFMVVDAALGYRLPQRRGLMSIEATNITDTRLKFQDDQVRTRFTTDVPQLSPFIPQRTVLLRVNLNL